MEETKQPTDQETIDRLRDEVRSLRTILNASDTGAVLLRQSEEFARLLAVSKLIVSELDLEKVFSLVADNARAIVNAELALVPMLNEALDHYTYVAASGADANKALGATLGAHVGMCGWVLRNQRSLLFGETSTHWLDEKTDWEAGQQSAALVPLFGRKGIIGGLSALGKEGGGCFTLHDLDLLTMFANQVSTAIENARLFRQVTREIEERKLTEQALRESEERFRAIFENSHDAIGVSREGNHVFANPAYYRLFGLAPNSVIRGKPILDLIAPGSRAQIRDNVHRRTRGEPVPPVYETRGCRADGTEFDMEVHASQYREKDADYTLVILRDISERRLLEAERLKSQKLESVGNLAGGIAHDFNNLLQGVFGYISLARTCINDTAKCIAALDQADQARRTAVRLTNQLLTFAKGGKPVKQPTDILPIIENSARFALSGSACDYRVTAGNDLRQVNADEGQIGQVVQNIVVNAKQAMPEGGTVDIVANNVTFNEDDNLLDLRRGRYVCMTISDSGTGISKDVMGKIFDPYFTTKEGGSGLGLATSYSIVKNHGGAIYATSDPGKGTTFFVYLPAMDREVPRGPEAASVPERTAGIRLLLLDDDPIVRDVAGELLTALGHAVVFAERGEEAIEKYQAARREGRPFDLVILDLTIRIGMGGAETIRRLLEIDPTVKAVASSGYSDDASVANCHEQGFQAFLNKPYNVHELQEILTRLVPTNAGS